MSIMKIFYLNLSCVLRRKIFLQDKNHSKDCRLPWFFNGYCEKVFCFEGADTYVGLPQNSVL